MDEVPRPNGRPTSSKWEGVSMSLGESFIPDCLKKAPQKSQNGRYIRGPIPLGWIQKACTVGAEKLALYLMSMKGLTKRSKIRLRSAEMERFGLSPKNRRIQLAKLEEASGDGNQLPRPVRTTIKFFPLQNFTQIVMVNQ